MKKKDKNKKRSALRKLETPLEDLEKLFILIKKHQVVELEWFYQDSPIKIKFQDPNALVLASPRPPEPQTTSFKVEPVDALSIPQTDKIKKITSPLVGIFYRAASPDSPPYVEEGKSIKRGDVLCIVEAMKLMNEIESDCSGKVLSIHVQNGQPVEFGELLFTIEI